MAALPFRRDGAGAIEILIITSRETGRFIIPKGWPIKGVSDSKAAAREALEEAGISGKVKQTPIGSYSYWKRFKEKFELVTVDVYPMEVLEHRESWLEKGQRKMAWLTSEDAASLIDEPALVNLIRNFKKVP